MIAVRQAGVLLGQSQLLGAWMNSHSLTGCLRGNFGVCMHDQARVSGMSLLIRV